MSEQYIIGTTGDSVREIKEEHRRAEAHRLDKETLQEQVTDYVRGVPNFPLKEGQLVSMVILHFDIPDSETKVMVDKTLPRLDRDELGKEIINLILRHGDARTNTVLTGKLTSYTEPHEVADQIIALLPTEEESRLDREGLVEEHYKVMHLGWLLGEAKMAKHITSEEFKWLVGEASEDFIALLPTGTLPFGGRIKREHGKSHH